MSRQLPVGRRKLRAAAFAILPVYLVLWLAGTGCLADILYIELQMSRCYYVLDLLARTPLQAGMDYQLLDVTFGIDIKVPPGYVSVDSSTSQSEAALRLSQRRAGQLAREIDMRIRASGSGLMGSTDLLDPIEIMAGDEVALNLLLDDLIENFYGWVTYEPMDDSTRLDVPSFRFPDAASRVKFTTVFDAELGIGYDLTEGELVFDGSVAVPEGSRAKVPKKVIVEIAHLDADGKVQSKHKQIVKVKKKTGKFKTSRKAFKGMELDEGDRVRVRMKPKGGDLTGLDWTLMPAYYFVR